MKPGFEILNEKKLGGKRLKISLAENKTFGLWRQFMPRRREIKNVAGIEPYPVEIFPEEPNSEEEI